MKKPDPEQQIQSPSTPAPPSKPLLEATDLSRAEEAMDPLRPRSMYSRGGMIFGAFVGLLMGSVVGTASALLIGFRDFLWQGAVIGALIGPIGGAIIGLKKSGSKRFLLSPDIATLILSGTWSS